MSLLLNIASESTLLQVKAKTDNLPGDPASQALTASAAQATGIKTQTDKLAGVAPALLESGAWNFFYSKAGDYTPIKLYYCFLEGG
jgi:hypothetical protein